MIYATDHQIKRMKELIRDYEKGYATAEDMYGFLVELNQTKRELTYEEETIILEHGREETRYTK